jgi:hypothetical protein
VYFPASGWLAASLLTLAVEVPIDAYLLRREEPDRVRLVVLVAFANLASHPAVWYLWTQVFLVGTTAYLVVAESWAVGVEAAIFWAAFRGLRPGRALVVSVAANAASFIAGTVVGAIWPGVFG